MNSIGLDGLDDTLRLGRLLAEMLVFERCQLRGKSSEAVQDSRQFLRDASVVLGLCGTLGAGKTNLVQSFISALGVPRHEITSPTFSLVQTYSMTVSTNLPLQPRAEAGAKSTEVIWNIHHIDAYRIADDDEFLELGIEELIEQPATLTLIEWAGKVENCLPADTLWIEIEYVSDHSRQVSFSSQEPRWAQFISELGSRFAAFSPP